MAALPSEPLPLPEAKIHVWRCSLAVESATLEKLWQFLNIEERARADRFHFQEHRRQFIVARATLRVLLGRYLDRNPASIEFVLGDRGKPFLEPGVNPDNLQFNLSHSQDMALVGFACDRGIGVDVEQLRWVNDAGSLAKRFFCATEYEAIAGLDADAQSQAFLRIWTAKEAFLKGVGSGIGGGLDSIAISLMPDRTFNFSFSNPQTAPANPWQLMPVDCGEGYVGTVAIEGDRVDVCTRQVERE